MKTTQEKRKNIMLLKSLKEKLIPTIFSEKQFEVIEKRLNQQKLTQTEMNYLSQAIKKKLEAYIYFSTYFSPDSLYDELYIRKRNNIIHHSDILYSNDKEDIEYLPRYQHLIKKLLKAKKIAILTGAGISKLSGLNTYRGEEGIWNTIDPIANFSENSFKKNPKKTIRLLEDMKKEILSHSPNIIHKSLAGMEKLFDSFTIITQNIDGYHQKAGSNDIIELHGNINKNKKKDGYTIPDIKLFYEEIDSQYYRYAKNALLDAEIIITIGTSGYFEYILDLLRSTPGYIININPEKTSISDIADTDINKPAEDIIPKLFNILLKNRLLKAFRTDYKNKNIHSIYLHGSIMKNRRAPNDIDIQIITKEQYTLNKDEISEIKSIIKKFSDLKIDIQQKPLDTFKQQLDKYKINIISNAILLYGNSIIEN